MQFISTNQKATIMSVVLFLFGSNLFAQANHSVKEQKNLTEQSEESVSKMETEKMTSSSESFKLSTVDEPQGNTLEAQIARAEFYKAQYAHEPATQAKYQQSIDALKKELAKTTTTKQD
jgi:N-acetylmuramoyl-L-alanine amidase CwlA